MFEIEDFPDIPEHVAELEKTFTAGRGGEKK